MTEVIGIRFRNMGKVYYFDPNGINFPAGSRAIVETARGVECGDVVMGNTSVEDDSIVKPLKAVMRAATDEDTARVEENARKEKEAFRICLKKIEEHGLKMKLIDAEYTFDNNKVLFYFTADGRVDFRELVKDLASVFRTRIELRQIGVRDEAKMLGGLGICGKPFCCSTFLGDFQPVSIKMAKEQNLSLNPTKISGTCGRLMCCLKYEQEAYEDLIRRTPRQGACVETADGKGIVQEANLLTGVLKIRLDSDPDSPKPYNRDDVKVLKGAEARAERSPAQPDDAGRQAAQRPAAKQPEAAKAPAKPENQN
jgi:cell fate regulator YaaT (PSP1 superfamily)